MNLLSKLKKREIEGKNWCFSICRKTGCGVFEFAWNSTDYYRYFAIHLLIWRIKSWQVGYKKVWYDGPYKSFGLGPFFLVSWN